MKINSKSSLRAARQAFVKVFCAGTILLLAAAGTGAQNLFVSAYGSGQINAFTPAGAQSTFVSGLNQPIGVAFDSVGNLYEADANTGNIFKFTPAGAQSIFAYGLNRPVGLTFDGSNNLFVAESGAGRIFVYPLAGGESILATGLNQPLGLAFDSGGNLFVADSGSGNIYKFTPAGVQSTFASGLQTPFGLAFDSAGNLYVAGYGNGVITEITPGGAQNTFASGLNLPSGLAFNNAGELFEGDFGSGNIFEFSPAGAQSTFASGLNQPAFLAFQPGTMVATNFNCPDDIITNNAPGRCPATVAFAANTMGSVVYTLGGSAISSPFPFPIGTNVVTCIVSNLDGITICNFTVLVRDIVPPMIYCPANILVGARSSSGAVVTFTVKASDQCAPSPQVASVPASGSLFPIGQTTVTSTAVDSWGNNNQCSFQVTVRDTSKAQALLVNLINYLARQPIQHGVQNALLSKLNNALSDLKQGQIVYALGVLTEFNQQVAAQNGKKLTRAQATALTSGANAVIAALGGQVSVVPPKGDQRVSTEDSD